MVTTPAENLQVAAFSLLQAAPREWEMFMQAFDAYVAETTKRLVAAEPHLLVNHQGQAVQANYIFQLLTNARKTAETLKAKPTRVR